MNHSPSPTPEMRPFTNPFPRKPSSPLQSWILAASVAFAAQVVSACQSPGAKHSAPEKKAAEPIAKPQPVSPPEPAAPQPMPSEASVEEDQHLLLKTHTQYLSGKPSQELVALFDPDRWKAYDLESQTLIPREDLLLKYFSDSMHDLDEKSASNAIKTLQEMKQGRLFIGAQGITWRLAREDYERPFQKTIVVFEQFIKEYLNYMKGKNALELRKNEMKAEQARLAEAPIELQERHAEQLALLEDQLNTPFTFSSPEKLHQAKIFFQEKLRGHSRSFADPAKNTTRVLVTPKYSSESETDQENYLKKMSEAYDIIALTQSEKDGERILILQAYSKGTILSETEVGDTDD